QGAMAADVPVCGPVEPAVLDRGLHRPAGAAASGGGHRDVVRVPAAAVPDEFGVAASAARPGVFELLSDDDPTALLHHKAVAIFVKGTARPLGRVVSP